MADCLHPLPSRQLHERDDAGTDAYTNENDDDEDDDDDDDDDGTEEQEVALQRLRRSSGSVVQGNHSLCSLHLWV